MFARSIADMAFKDQCRRPGDFSMPFIQLSLEHGTVPLSFKFTYVMPLLKKADMDPANVHSYWPISNLSVIFKLLERVV